MSEREDGLADRREDREAIKRTFMRLLIEVGGATADNWHLMRSIVEVTEADLTVALEPFLVERAMLRAEIGRLEKLVYASTSEAFP